MGEIDDNSLISPKAVKKSPYAKVNNSADDLSGPKYSARSSINSIAEEGEYNARTSTKSSLDIQSKGTLGSLSSISSLFRKKAKGILILILR